MAEHFQAPVNKLNNWNVNHFKIPEKHRGRTKCPRGPYVTRGPRVWDPDLEKIFHTSTCDFVLVFGRALFSNKHLLMMLLIETII